MRTVVVSRRTAPPRSSPGIDVARLIEETAKRHDLDPLLVHSVVEVESNYNPYAISSKGAEGLMQLIPSTARRFGVRNSFDPRENISGGVRYLRYLLDLFKDERLAVAAYNAGEEAVIRHGGVPPYRETRNYVNLVGNKYVAAKQAAGALTQSGGPANAAADVYRPIEQFVDEQGRLVIRTR